MDEHNFVLKNGDVLYGPLKLETDKITNDHDLINKEYFDKNQFVHTGDAPPDNPPIGAIFVHEDTLKEFIYVENNGDPIWVETSGCSGGGADGNFLKRYGDTIDDAQGDVSYSWNEEVKIKSDKSLTLEGTSEEIVRTIDDTDLPKQITNKEYVDDKDNFLQTEIRVLQEEIESIAPTIQAGIWQDGNSAIPGEGHFAMRKEGGGITQNYEEATINTLIISTRDKDGAVVSFTTEKVGDLIQLFDVEDKNFGLFEIETIDLLSTTDYATFGVKHVRGFGSTHVDDDVLIKTFEPPSGGTASEFVLRSGDDMTGAIEIDDATKITKPNHLVNKGYVDEKFLASGVPDYLQPYWKKGATILHWACEQNHSISARDGARLYIDGTLYRVFSSDMDLSLAGGISKEFVYVMPLEMEWHRLDSFFESKNNSNDNAQIRLLGYCQTEKNGSFASFFKNCKAFAGQGLEYLRYDSAYTLNSMFYGCSSFNGTININAPVATSAASMFKNCTSLNRSITVHLPTCETTDSMFAYCIAMTTNLISLPGCAMTSAKSMFAQCNNWQGNISMLDWDLSALHNAEKMFQACLALNIDISGWKLPSLHEANYMFENCHALDVDLSSWDLRHVKYFQSTFRNCYKLHGDYTNWKDWMCLAETVYYMFDRSSLVAGDVSDWILPFCQDQSYFSGGTLITGTPQYGMNSDGSLNPSCAPSTNFKNLGLHLHGTLRTTNTVLQVGNALKPDGTRFPQSSTITNTYRNYAEIQPGEEFYQLNTTTLYGFSGAENTAHEPGDYVEWHADSDTSKQGSMDYLVYHKEYNDHRFYDSIWVIKGLDKVIDVSGCTRLTYHIYFNFNNLGDGVDLPYTADVEYDLSNYDCTNLRFAQNVFASSVSYGGTGGRWYKLINFNQLQTPQKYKYCNVSSYGLFPPRWTDPQYDGQMWDPKELEGMDWSHLHATHFMFTGHNDEDVDASAIGMRPSTMSNTCYHMTNNWVKNLGDVDVSDTPYMRQVFRSCDFDEDLSQWCVRTVSTHTEFEYLPVAPISRNHLPQWGFCPRNEDDLDKYIH